MSARSRSVASTAPPTPAPAASRPLSSSTGVELRLRGWRPGFDKVRFTRQLRDGGVGLSEAVDLTERLLADEEISVRLGQFEDRVTAVAEFSDIGVGLLG